MEVLRLISTQHLKTYDNFEGNIERFLSEASNEERELFSKGEFETIKYILENQFLHSSGFTTKPNRKGFEKYLLQVLESSEDKKLVRQLSDKYLKKKIKRSFLQNIADFFVWN